MKPRILLLLLGTAALSASAAPNAPLKCGANQEKVWVYGNLKTFDVSARLTCGTPVELMGVESGFVKIRTSDGSEGYVPSEALPSEQVAALGAGSAPAAQFAAAKPAIAESAPMPLPAPAAAPEIKSAATKPPIPSTAPVHPLAREKAAKSPTEPAHIAASSAPRPLALLKPVDYTTVIKKPAIDLDDEEDLETDSVVREDLSACNVFFSAYGVTPMQYKWIADDRRKKFPGVCPAPEPGMVDYVVILTHDMNFFTTTLPEPIHTDANGFSDWTPVTSADDTLISSDSLDKAHREYAWVFHVKRGTFDPARFTSRRRPQFTKTESSGRASSKTIEDALQFMAGNGNAADR